MADLSLQEAAIALGVPYANLRKDAQRGKLLVKRDGQKVTVTQEAIDSYKTARGLELAAKEVEQGRPREAGNIIAQLPGHIVNAILAGSTPSGKKPVSPEPFLTAIAGAPTQEPIDLDGDADPHFGFPVGHQHASRPRWKRISASKWQLGTASWSWNGVFWEGGGSVDGHEIGDGIAPSSPDATMRPLGPPQALAK